MKNAFLFVIIIIIEWPSSESILFTDLLPTDSTDEYDQLIDRVAPVEDLPEFGSGSRGRDALYDIIKTYRTVVVYLTLAQRTDMHETYNKYRNAMIRIQKEDPDNKKHTFYTQHLCNGGPFCETMNVQTFPAIYIIQDGRLCYVYAGSFEEDHIYKSIKWFAFNGVIQVTNFEILKNLLVDEIHTIAVGFFRKKKTMNETFHQVAQDLQSGDIWFAYCQCKKLTDKICKFINDKQLSDHLVLLRSKRLISRYEAEVQVYKYDANYTTMREWLIRQHYGVLGLRYDWNKEYFRKPLIVFYLNLDFLFKNYTAKYKYWRNRLIALLKPYEKQYTFAISNKNDIFFEDFRDIPIDLPTNFDNKESLVVVIHNTNNQRYVLSNYTNTSFIAFVNNFQKSLLTQSYLRSETIPKKHRSWDEEESRVQNISGETIHHLIYHQDFFLYIYAKWCGLCQEFHHEYENLANKFKQHHFYQIDGTKNELINGVNATAYPVIYYIKRELRQPPIRFQGCNMSYEDVECWIEDIIKLPPKPEHSIKIKHEEL